VTAPDAAALPRPARTPASRQWRVSARLAWADFLHEWRVSLCLVTALAAVLTPLLVLFGLKFGVVTAMTDRLTANPLNRQVSIVGSHRLGPDWFARMSSRPEVAFVLPRTRSLAATLEALMPSGRALPPLAMVPTAPGDPLLAGVPIPRGPFEAVVSHPVAERMGIGPGDGFTGLVTRQIAGRQEAVRLPLRVVGVLPEALAGRNAVYVALDLLVATEEYRDGRAVPLLGVEAGDRPPPGTRHFAGARLFARDLDDVAVLARTLRAEGMEVQTRAEDIETVKAVDRVLGVIFHAVAGIAVTGFLVSLAASLWANVERKRRDLALMRLLGFSTASVCAFPAGQAMLVALAGTALSLAAYSGVAALLNATLSANLAEGEFVCRLLPRHAAAAAGLTVALSLAASLVGGRRAFRIEPAESLREH
jgi:putative ABC transport system permease protein